MDQLWISTFYLEGRCLVDLYGMDECVCDHTGDPEDKVEGHNNSHYCVHLLENLFKMYSLSITIEYDIVVLTGGPQ